MHRSVRIARPRLLYVLTRGQNLDRKRDTRQERIFADTVSGTALGWTGSPEAFRQSLRLPVGHSSL